MTFKRYTGVTLSEVGSDIKARWQCANPYQQGFSLSAIAALLFVAPLSPALPKPLALASELGATVGLVTASGKFKRGEKLRELQRLEAEQKVNELEVKQFVQDEIDAAITAEKITGLRLEARKRYIPPEYLPQALGLPHDTLKDAKTAEPAIPEEDLAKAIAQCQDMILVVAPTQCGKTSLLNAVVCESAKLTPQPDFKIFDGKNGYFGGVEDSPADYLDCSTLDQYRASDLVNRLDTILGVIEKRYAQRKAKRSREIEGYPMRVLVDEANNIQKGLKHVPKLEKDDPSFQDQFIQKVGVVFTQGKEAKVLALLTSHTTRVDTLGFDTADQGALAKVCLGREHRFSEVREAIEKWSKGADRKCLEEQLDCYLPERTDDQVPVALTDVGGPLRLITLPFYDKFAKADLGIVNQPSAALFDEAEASPKDAKGGKPKPSPSPKPKGPMPEDGEAFLSWLALHPSEWITVPEAYRRWGKAEFQNLAEFAQFLVAISAAGRGEFRNHMEEFRGLGLSGLGQVDEVTAARLESIKRYLKEHGQATARDIKRSAPSRKELGLETMSPGKIRELFKLLALLPGYETSGRANQLSIRRV